MIEGQQGSYGHGSDNIFQEQNNLKLRGLLPPPTAHRLDQDGNHITVPKWDEVEGLPSDWETYRYYRLSWLLS